MKEKDNHFTIRFDGSVMYLKVDLLTVAEFDRTVGIDSLTEYFVIARDVAARRIRLYINDYTVSTG